MTATKQQPAPGIIYEYHNGYAAESWRRVTLNADLSVTIEDAQTERTMNLGVLYQLGTLEAWARDCFEAANGRNPGFKLGPVGYRIARKYALRSGALGSQRAAAFHRALSRLGFPAAAHYELCAKALGRPVLSLATLSEDEARRAWFYARRPACPPHAA